jgi:hypothetical protein
MSAHDYRTEAQGLLRQIKNAPDMSVSLASTRFSQALALMVQVHNESVEPEAREDSVHPPRVGEEQLKLLRQAFLNLTGHVRRSQLGSLD